MTTFFRYTDKGKWHVQKGEGDAVCNFPFIKTALVTHNIPEVDICGNCRNLMQRAANKKETSLPAKVVKRLKWERLLMALQIGEVLQVQNKQGVFSFWKESVVCTREAEELIAMGYLKWGKVAFGVPPEVVLTEAGKVWKLEEAE